MKRTGLMIAALGLFFWAQAALADWTPAQRLTWSSGESLHPKVALGSGNTVHVVWDDSIPGHSEIYYKKSTDGGTTWGPAKRLTWSSGNSKDPAIAIDSIGRLHVAWYCQSDYDIHYKRSTDGGGTWSATRRLTWTSGDSLYPDIDIGKDDTVHIAWFDWTPGNSEIYYKMSVDGGLNWSAARRLTWTSANSYFPAMAIDPYGRIHVIFYESVSGSSEVFYTRSTNGGTTWGAKKRLTWTAGSSYAQAIAADPSNNIHVAWMDNTSGYDEVLYKKSTDGGSSWGGAQRLSLTSGSSYWPALAADASGNIHVGWHDNTPGLADIYYRKSTDGGVTWEATQRLTWTSGSSFSTALDVDASNNVHVVWYDDTPGNHEIYYKKGN
jgi:BNR repeat-containing family member